jgi:hypothetical protein
VALVAAEKEVRSMPMRLPLLAYLRPLLSSGSDFGGEGKDARWSPFRQLEGPVRLLCSSHCHFLRSSRKAACSKTNPEENTPCLRFGGLIILSTRHKIA